MTLGLYYFPLRARGEPLKMLLQYARIPFVDHVIMLDEWPAQKEKMPMGKNGQQQVSATPQRKQAPASPSQCSQRRCQCYPMAIASSCQSLPTSLPTLPGWLALR